ncbi:MAG: molecular chaperone TorD family protein [Rubrivivax sp.]|nr:molecular chaperone TorD family protein [Rubrivivax sp.]
MAPPAEPSTRPVAAQAADASTHADETRRRAAERDAARADLARFIAACYYEPGPEFAEERLFDSMRAAAARVDPALEALAQRLGEAFAAAPLQELSVDHARLFLGPGPARARPYASVWLTGENRLMEAPALEVRQLYAEAGFELDASFLELPDHVAAELEFFYLLIHRANVAHYASDAQAQAEVAALRRRFVDEHLGRWLGPFLLAMHEGAETVFYETLAELTEAFVRREAAGPPGEG